MYLYYINRDMLVTQKLGDVVSHALLILHVRYTPLGLLKRNCYRILEQSVEWLQVEASKTSGRDRLVYTRMIKRLEHMQEVFESVRSRRHFALLYYNFILTLSGYALLRGFGFSNYFGDHIQGDAERLSLRGTTLMVKEGREVRIK